MTVAYWQDRSQGKVKTKDVVIIGAGIAGLSTAYWLNQLAPELDIAVVEKGEMGSGASGRNAGFITCGSVEHFNRLVQKHGKDEASAIWKFSEVNLELLKAHILTDSELQKMALFEQKGSFSLASSESELLELKKSADIMQAFGIKVEMLNAPEIEKRLGAIEFVGGIKYIDDASVHPMRLLELIKAKVSTQKQFELLENHEVYRITEKAGQKQIFTSKLYLETPLVILATNAYSPLLHSYFADKIYPTRGQILCTAPVERFMESACYAHFVLDYFRQLPTGEMLIGGFRQLQKDVELGYADITSDIIQQALEQFLNRHIPKVRNIPITHRWSGLMGFSADGQPLIGSLPSDPQIAFLGGFTAHGMGLAFHSAKILVESLLEEKPLPSYLSARRFA